MFKFPKKIPKNLEFEIKSLPEEKANVFSHFAGVLFCLVSAPFILYNTFLQEDNFVILGLVVYIISFLMLFLSSTLYHQSFVAKTRKNYRTLDHVSIYVFISGTYTPLILLYVNNSFGLYVLLGLWLATLIGIIYKTFFLGKFRIISTIIYLLMGWTAIFIFSELKESMTTSSFYWVIIGGLIYTFGTFFYINTKIKYNHFVWHIAVLFGAISHFIAIYNSIDL